MRHAATFLRDDGSYFREATSTTLSPPTTLPCPFVGGHHLATLATRVTLAPFDEAATMTHLQQVLQHLQRQHLQRRRVQQHVAILEFDFGEERRGEAQMEGTAFT